VFEVQRNAEIKDHREKNTITVIKKITTIKKIKQKEKKSSLCVTWRK
jgi:hypothetical protein